MTSSMPRLLPIKRLLSQRRSQRKLRLPSNLTERMPNPLPRVMMPQRTKTMARTMKSQEMMMKQKPLKRLHLVPSKTRRKLLPQQVQSVLPRKQLPQPSRTQSLQMPNLTSSPRRLTKKSKKPSRPFLSPQISVFGSYPGETTGGAGGLTGLFSAVDKKFFSRTGSPARRDNGRLPPVAGSGPTLS